MIYKTKEKINTLDCNDLAADLRRILEQGDDLIIDLSNTNYISSNGLRVLLMGLKTFRAKGYDFSVVNVNDQVKEIFDVTGLTNVLLISDKDRNRLKR